MGPPFERRAGGVRQGGKEKEKRLHDKLIRIVRSCSNDHREQFGGRKAS